MMDRRDDTDRYLEESEISPDVATSPTLDEATSEMDDRTQADVAEIEADIVETRAELGGTLGEIGERLDPGHVADQAREKVREATIGRVEDAVESAGDTARGMSEMLMDTIKNNPIPTAMAGIGLAWLWRNRSDGHGGERQTSRHLYGRDRYGSDPYGTGRYRAEEQGGLGGALEGAREGAQHGVQQAGERVGQTAGQVVEGAQEMAGSVAYGAQQTAGQLGSQAQRIMHEMPLAVGLVALGAGAIVGALVPDTRIEEEILAEPGSRVLEAAGETASQAGEKAQRAAEKATEAAREEVKAGA